MGIAFSCNIKMMGVLSLDDTHTHTALVFHSSLIQFEILGHGKMLKVAPTAGHRRYAAG